MTATGTIEESVGAADSWKPILDGLARPFEGSQIRQRDAPGGKRLSYITARMVMYRLDDIVGAQNWEDKYTVIDPDRMGTLCELTIFGVTKSGVGYPNNNIGTKGDRGKPGKDAESDALKRAAVKWGIGRHLYGEHYEYEDEGEGEESGVRADSSGERTSDASSASTRSSGDYAANSGGSERGSSEKQQKKIFAMCKKLGHEVPENIRDISSTEASAMIDALIAEENGGPRAVFAIPKNDLIQTIRTLAADVAFDRAFRDPREALGLAYDNVELEHAPLDRLSEEQQRSVYNELRRLKEEATRS